MKRKGTFTVFMTVLALLLSGAVYAGDPDSAAAPNATSSYTLEDLYNRLDTGTDGAQSTFTEPAAGPAAGTMHTVNEVMGKAPEKDNTDGAVAADVANGKTFWGLNEGAGQWGPQTGTAAGGGASAGVPKTGQTPTVPINPAPEGSDGSLQKGVAWPSPRFTDNSNGTVTDNLTGLIWLQNANCFGLRNWTTALTDANGLADGACGLTDSSSAGDWHLPNVKELHSLIDFANFNPALPAGHPFTGVQSGRYWSATTYAVSTTFACYVFLSNGYVSSAGKTLTYYVWPVR